MTNKYPFYLAVGGDELEQGDVLLRCPIILPPPTLTFPIATETIDVRIQIFDAIIMTQSCDLANDKVTDVALCPHWDLTERGLYDPQLAKKDVQKQILNGYRHRYAMLAASDVRGLDMGVRIVDFGSIFSLPKSFVRQYAAKQGRRLRLCPPYREHLSQSFARFFMRVGLPQNIELP